MGIRFLLGRAGSGKSTQVLDELRGELRRAPDGYPLYLLVPEQATFQMEHALVSTPGIGGLLRAQVLSFRRLAWRVMQETGGTAGIPIDDTGKAMLLTRLLHTYRDEWKWFAGSADKMGEVSRLAELLGELKRYCVSPDDLGRWLARTVGEADGNVRRLQDKLSDLQRLAQAFEHELAQQYLDGDDFLARLAERLPEAGFLRGAEVWIDGFFGFTPQEQAAVVQLCRHCRRVTLALTLHRAYTAGEKPHELELFHPTAMTMIRLREALAECGVTDVEIERLPEEELPRFRGNPALAHLEREYEQRLTPRKRTLPYGSVEPFGLTVVQAVNRRAEVEGAAREIVRLARENGLRWRDMAVRVRNLEAYGDLLTAVFADYGIPYFMDQKRSVLHHPLPELIRSALETVLHRWRYDPVFRCVRTGFFGPLPEEGATAEAADELERAVNRAFDELENYVLAHGIQGSRWHEPRSWRLSRHIALEDGDIARAPDEAAQARLEASRQELIEPLGQFDRAFGKAGSVREMTSALFALLTELQVPERLTRWSEQALERGLPDKAREHEQVWDRIVDVLDQLVELMGDATLEKRLFVKLVEAGLESIRLGLVPPSLDQVLIGSIDRTRSAQVKVSLVLGASDGELPARPKEDGILTEQERDRLAVEGLTLADGSRRKLLDEPFLIYTVLCASSTGLWLSYPLADEEGKTLLPSELIGQIRGLFPGLPIKQLGGEPPVEEGDERALPFLVNESRALSYLTVQLREWMKGRPIAGVWWSVYDRFVAQPEARERLAAAIRSLAFTNEERGLDNRTSLELYGSQFSASVSRMERFVECPFSQFASHGLRLRERQLYRLEAPDIGQLYHAALKTMVERLYGPMSNRLPPDDRELAAAASAVVDALAPRLQSEILLSSSRFQYIARKLKGVVHRAAAMLAEHARSGAFVPVGLELGFGPGEPLPPLTYRLPNGRTMDIVGRIDRVDKAEEEQGLLLRVIDYKSSRTALQLSEVYYGLSLQMLTYLDVLLTHAERWLGRKALPAGVLYFHVHNPLLSSKNALAPDTAEAQARKQLRMKGLVRADAETVRLMDEGLRERHGASDLIDVALTKDGGFHKRSLVASDPQWEGLRGYVRQVIGQIGTELTNGNVAISPYRIGQETPCMHCSYKPVCAFDPLVPGNKYQTLPKPDKDELWRAFAEAGASRQTGLRIQRTGGDPSYGEDGQ